jgi:uncharacterized protein YbbK (DUF523 family)
VGVSSCLLGEPVRYDGGHKRNASLIDELGLLVEWVPVCPEFEAGLGVPRPAMRLVRDGDGVRMLEIESGRDHTVRMERFATERVRELAALDLCGYVLKRNSPSCGLERVPVHDDKGKTGRGGVGLFAAALSAAYPELPVEDEARLDDPVIRESFIARIVAYSRRR